jgi:hypothetical protein
MAVSAAKTNDLDAAFHSHTCEHEIMECKPTRINASIFAVNVSMSTFSFAINLNPKLR